MFGKLIFSDSLIDWPAFDGTHFYVKAGVFTANMNNRKQIKLMILAGSSFVDSITHQWAVYVKASISCLEAPILATLYHLI